jgi:hypothetical protein
LHDLPIFNGTKLIIMFLDSMEAWVPKEQKLHAMDMVVKGTHEH